MNIDHDGFRQKALAAIETVSMASEREREPDYKYGWRTARLVRLPSAFLGRREFPRFTATTCGEAILAKESVAAVVALVEREGSDAWYEKSAE